MKEFVLETQIDPKNCKIDYKTELNKEQFDVVVQGDGPCLVLAGAGSGKTRTITYRLAYLIERGVQPNNILLVTFTNKAASEMVSRVETLLNGYPRGLWSGTFHSVANRILRMYADRLGYTPSFTILDQEDSKTLLKVCLKELKIDTSAKRFPSPRVLSSIISFSRNATKSIHDVVEKKYSSYFDLIGAIEGVAELYRKKKKEGDSMDFDDLLVLLRQLLEQDPVIRNRLAEQFRYILVDEYQDTNRIQSDIVRQLASVHGNILVVGDDAQSIYSFRAADINHILNFPKVFDGTDVFRLTTNYRSTPEILSLANCIIERNTSQFEKNLIAVCESFEKPNMIPATNGFQEASYIAEQVVRLRDDGVDLSSVAVLFRAAFHSQQLEMELAKRDIPYEFRGGLKFFERAHIKDVIAYLRVFVNTKDESAWLRVLGHQPGIGLVTAGKIIKQVSVFDTMEEIVAADVKLGKRAASGWEGFRRIMRAVLKGSEKPSEIIRAVSGSDYRDYLEAEYPDFMDRLDDLEQFAFFGDQYEDMHTFLDEVTLRDEFGAIDAKSRKKDTKEKMVLSTIHQSKGLEWDAVFVMRLADGQFPNPRALKEVGGVEEERRLFYVATTRARKYLYLTYPLTSGFDSMMVHAPSMFLTEIPKGQLEEVRIKETYKKPRFVDRSGFYNDDSAIVLDDSGERTKKDAPKSFLSDF